MKKYKIIVTIFTLLAPALLEAFVLISNNYTIDNKLQPLQITAYYHTKQGLRGSHNAQPHDLNATGKSFVYSDADAGLDALIVSRTYSTSGPSLVNMMRGRASDKSYQDEEVDVIIINPNRDLERQLRKTYPTAKLYHQPKLLDKNTLEITKGFGITGYFQVNKATKKQSSKKPAEPTKAELDRDLEQYYKQQEKAAGA